MALQNLQSIFNEDLESKVEQFQSNQPAHSNDSRVSEIVGAHVQKPILNSVQVGASSFVDSSTLSPKYDEKNFDSRVSRPGTVILNKNTYKGSVLDLPLPPSETETNFSLTSNKLKFSGGWSALYNRNHTPKPLPSTVDLTNPFQPYFYGDNVSREGLNIRNSSSPQTFKTISSLFSRGTEPYIVHALPENAVDFSSGRGLNFGNRQFPIRRAFTDLDRIGSFMRSPAGTFFQVNKLLSQAQPTSLVMKKSDEKNVRRDNKIDGNEEIDRIRQRYNNGFSKTNLQLNVLRNQGMNISADPLQTGGFLGLYSQYDSDSPIFHSINGTSKPGALGFLGKVITGLGGVLTKDPQKGLFKDGDEMTTEILKEYDAASFKPDPDYDTAGSKKGMPFYFVDLRDNKVLYFRAYLEGITENISPSWSETNYIGRSEPVYVYEKATRDISFTLKLYAHTYNELKHIYAKLNRLTSMCYPQYQEDELFDTAARQRMKPPLTKFRMGDLYGKSGKKELTGFLKSLTYTIPEESPWEMNQYEKLPRFVIATISYQVIHGNVPELMKSDGSGEAYEFYGLPTDWNQSI